MKNSSKIRWAVAHGPFELVENMVTELRTALDKGSSGRLTLEVVLPDDDFSTGFRDIKGVIGSVACGDMEMSQLYVDTLIQYDPRLAIYGVPFLFEDYPHIERFFTTKEAQESLDGLVAGSGGRLRGLAYTFCGGYRVMATGTKELRRIEDFSGLKIYPDLSTYNHLGMAAFEALKIERVGGEPYEKVPEMIADGRADGVESTYSVYSTYEMNTFAPVINETSHSMVVTMIVVNEPFYQSLSPEEQLLLKQAVQQAAKRERAATITRSLQFAKKYKFMGGKIIRMDEREYARFQQVLAPVRALFPYPNLLSAAEMCRGPREGQVFSGQL